MKNIEINRSNIPEDQPGHLVHLIDDKRSIYEEDRADITAQLIGKNLDVTEYIGDNIDLLIGSIKEDAYDCVIVEISSDYSLEELNSLMQCLKSFCTPYTVFLTGISGRTYGVTCTCIKTVFGQNTPQAKTNNIYTD